MGIYQMLIHTYHQNVITMEHNIHERRPNTTVDGKPFDDVIINAVWEKAKKEFGFYFYKKDGCSAIIAKHEYGQRSKYGWEIDHIIPVSMGGTDDLENLQALHWENNSSKGENYPEWTCKRKG
jgi:hypothetical protein